MCYFRYFSKYTVKINFMRNSIFLVITLLSFSCFGQKKSSVKTNNNFQVNLKLQDSLKTLQDSTDFLLFQGKYDKVILNSIEHIKFGEKIGDTVGVNYSKYMVAMAFLYLEDYENSGKYLKEYTEYALKSKNDFEIARAHNFTGALYVSEKKYDSAQMYFMKALPLSKKLGDTLEVSIVYYNLSESNLNLGNQKKAADYYKKAKKGIDELDFKGLTTEMDLLEGKLNVENKEYNKALIKFKSAIAFAENGGYIDKTLIEVYKELSNAHYLSGNLQEAYKTRKTYDSLNLLQFEKNKVIAVQNANAKFNVNQFKKKANEAELEKQLIEEKAKWNNSLLYFFIITAALLIIFLLFVGRANSRRKHLLKLLREKNTEYRLAKEKSEQLAMAKTKFFSTISHELRTPLYGVIGLSSSLLEDESLFEHRDDLKNLKFSADYLLALINDVLDYSKIDATPYLENAKHFSIRDLIESISNSFKHILEENHNNLKISIAENVPKYIYGDRIRLMQILMNLLGNATKFTANGAIEIFVNILQETETQISLTFSIKDNGIGIPEDLQQTIFEEFQQIRNDKKTSQKGTGLGLSIVKKLLEQTNSSINLKSTVGKGPNFHLI